MTERERLARILEGATDAVLTWDAHDRVLWSRHKYGQGTVAYTFDENEELIDISVERDEQ